MPGGFKKWRAGFGWRRGRALAGALLVFAWLQGCGGEPPAALAGGGNLRFSELTGRWVVINYWAEWCAPCWEEIPELNKLEAHGGGRSAVVLGVNYDAVQGDRLVDLIARMGIRFPVLWEDPRGRWGYPQPDVLPTTVIIGPDGKLRDQLRGPQTLEALLAAIGRSD